jgi:hypothetical protein
LTDFETEFVEVTEPVFGRSIALKVRLAADETKAVEALDATGVVADEALHRAPEIVTRMLAGRPDIQTMAGTRLTIIGKDQVYADMPEYRNHLSQRTPPS